MSSCITRIFFFFLEQIEKEEQAAAEKAIGKEEFQGEWSTPAAAEFTQPEVADWSEGVAVPSVPIQQFPACMLYLHRVKIFTCKPNTII